MNGCGGGVGSAALASAALAAAAAGSAGAGCAGAATGSGVVSVADGVLEVELQPASSKSNDENVRCTTTNPPRSSVEPAEPTRAVEAGQRLRRTRNGSHG